MHPQEPGTSKIVTLPRLRTLRSGLADEGLTLVQCHGCFDIVHPGHVRHLKYAARQGDRLVVSITADAFVNKGPGRPMFPHDLRAENMAALEFVDFVLVHHEETAAGLLGEVRPDIYIKGAEYASNNDPRFEEERAIVERHGGRVVFSSPDVVFSSTSIVRSIKENSGSRLDGTPLAQLAQQHDLSTAMIRDVLGRASGKRVVVVGESIIDVYQHCQWPLAASEHPMLSLRPTETQRFDGGAAVIAKHLASLGQRPLLCTPLDDDEQSKAFLARMEADGVEVVAIPCDHPLPHKTRYVVGRDKVMKIDSSTRYAMEPRHVAGAIDRLRREERIDAMVVADFGLGFLSDGLAGQIIAGLRDRAGIVLGDVSGMHCGLLAMRGADVLCPCESELRHAMSDHDSPLQVVAMGLLERLDAKVLCVTLGDKGLVAFTRDRGVFEMPAMIHDPADVLGCGDALLSALGAAMLGGANLVQASYIGSIAAAVAGSRLGNWAVGREQILEAARSLAAHHAHDLSQTAPNGSRTESRTRLGAL